MGGSDSLALRRRALLSAVAGAGAGLAGCSVPGGDPAAGDAATARLDDERTRDLAERFAPVLYFDADERWFPTDPRPYERERDGETVVDGFAALNDYAAAFDPESPPAPTAFYNAVRYEDSPLAVVQYWFYAAFDQFTTNFHWHDWEVLHVFVDLDSGAPQLFVASSHSRSVPNNEYLDPERSVARILPELGSHSSALSLNEQPDRFRRLPGDDVLADITNSALEGVPSIEDFPAAYGLPRDEGARLPYVVPELDGAPLYEHDRLPDVERDDLVSAELTVRSFDALSRPPTELPRRSTGLVFGRAGRDDGADVDYDLVPTAELEHISAFTGPQLSFEFAVPEFVEDAVAGHITTTGEPWNQDRYENPAADVTDPLHRRELSDRYEAIADVGGGNAVVASVRQAIESDDAPDGEGLTTRSAPVEAVALLESDPAAVPTFRGVALAQGVPEGEHRLTVNGAGFAPHSESVTVADGATAAGVDGAVPLVAREAAAKLEVDADGAEADLDRLAVEDDFAGRLYDAPIEGPDAVYVHRGGAYTAEVRDADDEVGAFRVSPDAAGAGDGDDDDDAGESEDDGDERGSERAETVRIDHPETGAASLSSYVATVSEETRAEIEALLDDADVQGRGNAVRGLVRALDAVGQRADRAAQRARDGDRAGAEGELERVGNGLEQVAQNLERSADALPDPIEAAVDRRLEQAERRTEQAAAAEKLS
ncbi:hypothetical protein [Halomicrobium salinisoli]|uniref:hypothetical protein n=1 Tax=Halomicrobium salinisoli TaxID=2878391 RepID=UPI001CEFBC36|nr:hypothetical protein [Halomicrobium salinisoli]